MWNLLLLLFRQDQQQLQEWCCWCSGSSSLSATGPVAVAWLTIAAVGAAVAGGMDAEKGIRKDARTAADKLGEDFFIVLLREEPFKSMGTVGYTIASSATCAPDACHGTWIDSVASISVHWLFVVDGDDPEVVGAVILRDVNLLLYL